jgi:hypothetical protein
VIVPDNISENIVLPLPRVLKVIQTNKQKIRIQKCAPLGKHRDYGNLRNSTFHNPMKLEKNSFYHSMSLMTNEAGR